MKFVFSLIIGLSLIVGCVHSICIKHLLYGMQFSNQTEGEEVEKNVQCAVVNIGTKLENILDHIDNTTQAELDSVTNETDHAVSILNYYAQLLIERNTSESLDGIAYVKKAFEAIVAIGEELLEKANDCKTTNNQSLLDNVIEAVTAVIAKLKILINSLSA